jgi:hypothetical protein
MTDEVVDRSPSSFGIPVSARHIVTIVSPVSTQAALLQFVLIHGSILRIRAIEFFKHPTRASRGVGTLSHDRAMVKSRAGSKTTGAMPALVAAFG